MTALFRRPLGLPIPHTAIIPNNKDRIGDGLGSFVERNFLEPSLVAAKLRSIDPAKPHGALAERAGDRGRIWRRRLTTTLPTLIQSVEDRELRDFFGSALGEQLRGTEISPLLGKVLGVLVSSGQHQPLLERVVAWALDPDGPQPGPPGVHGRTAQRLVDTQGDQTAGSPKRSARARRNS